MQRKYKNYVTTCNIMQMAQAEADPVLRVTNPME